MKQWKKQQRQERLAKKLHKQRTDKIINASILGFAIVVITSTVAFGKWYTPVVIKQVYAEVKKVIAPPLPPFSDLVKSNLLNPRIRSGGYPYWMSYDKKDKCYKGIMGTYEWDSRGGDKELLFTIDPSNKSLIAKFEDNYGHDSLFTYETINPTKGICGTNILTSLKTYAELDAEVAKDLAAK